MHRACRAGADSRSTGRRERYIDRFVETSSNIVAEEQIRQEADDPRAKRTIRSDFVVVRFPGSQLYVFRDAFEVGGQRVRDPENERLPKLFDEPTMAALTHAQELSNATTRHYIRDIGTVNNPLLVISLLERKNRHRFFLSVAGKEGKLGPTVRRIGFKEVVTPTVLRWGGNIDMPAEGWLWVDESTGRIVKTELKLGERDISRAPSPGGRPRSSPSRSAKTRRSGSTSRWRCAVARRLPRSRQQV
jgi:hypothetical protein